MMSEDVVLKKKRNNYRLGVAITVTVLCVIAITFSPYLYYQGLKLLEAVSILDTGISYVLWNASRLAITITSGFVFIFIGIVVYVVLEHLGDNWFFDKDESRRL
ncbi:hypothetical protein ACFL24_02785 [Patescibacteria group bacterium]